MIDFSKEPIENDLWPRDEELLNSMVDKYVSENEKVFFETLRMKMLKEYAPCGDVLLHEMDNTDEIYLARREYDEFVVGSAKGGQKYNHIHVMSFSEFMNANLMKLGYIVRNLTLWQWLRERDYAGINYQGNNI